MIQEIVEDRDQVIFRLCFVELLESVSVVKKQEANQTGET